MLGASVIWSGRHVHVTTIHVVTGAVILAVALVLAVRSWRFGVYLNRTQTSSVAGEGMERLGGAPA